MKMINCANCDQEMSQKAPMCPKCGHPNKKAKHLSGKTVFLTFLLAAGTIWWLAYGDYTDSVTPGGTNPGQAALSGLKLKELSWTKGGFDSTMMLSVIVQNNGKSDVKDIVIECRHSSPSGTKIDSNKKTIYEVFPAGEDKKIDDFNMGFIHEQATTTNCSILKATLM